jgi:hypothetical protein
MKLPAWLAQMLTEDDANSVICPVRVIGASGALTLIGNSIWATVAHGAFDPAGFGAGVAAIAGAVGVGAGIKAKLGA